MIIEANFYSFKKESEPEAIKALEAMKKFKENSRGCIRAYFKKVDSKELTYLDYSEFISREDYENFLMRYVLEAKKSMLMPLIEFIETGKVKK
ncbi:MAG TPA: hypothetical protein VJK05_04295 [archaeon]|nr:hypothetical protein [archaeon]